MMQGKVGSYLDGPWMQGFMAQATPEVKPHLKAAPVPFPNVMGGASNLIAVARNASDNQKKLAIEFVQSLTTKEAQVHYAETQGTAPPRQDVELPATLKEKYPYSDVWIEASKKAVNYLPVGLETKANEWQQLVSEAGQQMVTQGREAADVAGELQKKLEELQKA
jgi:ABC-type glycerol-3-phosphate transport system substrate-binding protein